MLDETIGNTCDAHFLTRRGRRRHVEQVTRQAPVRRAAFVSSPFDRRAPRRHRPGWQREQRQQPQRGMNRHQKCDRHAKPQDPPTRREQRHVHVVEHEDLIAEDREAIEIIGSLLVRNRRNRREQRCHVRLERDRHLVAEAAGHARADGLKKPRRGRGHPERQRGDAHVAPVALQHALTKHLEPQREQRIRKRRQQRQ